MPQTRSRLFDRPQQRKTAIHAGLLVGRIVAEPSHVQIGPAAPLGVGQSDVAWNIGGFRALGDARPACQRPVEIDEKTGIGAEERRRVEGGGEPARKQARADVPGDMARKIGLFEAEVGELHRDVARSMFAKQHNVGGSAFVDDIRRRRPIAARRVVEEGRHHSAARRSQNATR